jgi:predicted nucleotidyltransferase
VLLQRPFEALTPTLDGSVLQVLAGADTQFTVSRVTALVGDASTAGVRKALNRLVGQGLVARRGDGVAYLYELNRSHLLAGPVLEIARARETLRERVAEHASTWPQPPLLLALFGSAARGQMHQDSDLDVLAVADEAEDRWLDDLGSLCDDLTSWTGNDARPLVLTPDELTSERDAVVVEIGRDALVLFGDTALLRHARRLAAKAGAA